MMLYACLLLLPTTVLAVCNKTVTLTFFDDIDTNDDGSISSSEINVLVDKIDGNKDKSVTRQELKDNISLVSPNSVGQDVVIFDFFDKNRSGTVNSQDFTLLYLFVNTDGNTNISRQEIETYLNSKC